MSISSRFAVGVHILTLLEINKEGVSSSKYLAGSVNTNPAVIRKLLSMLKKAGLVESSAGIAGARLARNLADISLLDVYQAVETTEQQALIKIHEEPNPKCIVGRNIQQTIEPLFASAQQAMERVLAKITLADIVQDVIENEQKADRTVH